MLHNTSGNIELPEKQDVTLANELFDNVSEEPLLNFTKNLINERLKYHEEHPEGGTDWDILRREYLA